MKKNKLFIGICLCLSVFLLVSCNSINNFVCFSTLCEFEVTGGSTKQEINSLYESFQSLESILSTSNPSSEISLINGSLRNQPVQVSNDIITLFEISKGLYDISNNYNPAIFPVVELWGFDPTTYVGILQATSIPTQTEIDLCLTYCDMNFFVIDKNKNTITKTIDQAKLDFGSIAKGFACELAYNKLKHNNKAIVNIGGTIKTTKVITVHVKNPKTDDNTNSYSAKITLPAEKAISTSGDYERFYIYNGTKYHHLISSDGYPAWVFEDNKILSASIIGEDSTICDALSTLLFVEGVTNKTRQILDYHKCSALIIYNNSHQVLGDLDYLILDESFKTKTI